MRQVDVSHLNGLEMTPFVKASSHAIKEKTSQINLKSEKSSTRSSLSSKSNSIEQYIHEECQGSPELAVQVANLTLRPLGPHSQKQRLSSQSGQPGLKALIVPLVMSYLPVYFACVLINQCITDRKAKPSQQYNKLNGNAMV